MHNLKSNKNRTLSVSSCCITLNIKKTGTLSTIPPPPPPHHRIKNKIWQNKFQIKKNK